MTDKYTMQRNYDTVMRDMRNAKDCLRNAENILRNDFVIDDSGYCADQLNDNWDYLDDYGLAIEYKIIAAINNL